MPSRDPWWHALCVAVVSPAAMRISTRTSTSAFEAVMPASVVLAVAATLVAMPAAGMSVGGISDTGRIRGITEVRGTRIVRLTMPAEMTL